MGKKLGTYLKNLKYRPLDLLKMRAQYMYDRGDNNSSQQNINNIKTINSTNIS